MAIGNLYKLILALTVSIVFCSCEEEYTPLPSTEGPKYVVEGYIRIKKDNPVFDDITSDLDLNSLADTDIVIVDDVANSGRTLMFALKPFMNGVFKKIRIAVLVDRAHKKFPVCPDFVGYSMATTIKNRIELVFHVDNTAEAFLTE